MVLVVDDESVIADTLAEILSRSGYTEWLSTMETVRWKQHC